MRFSLTLFFTLNLLIIHIPWSVAQDEKREAEHSIKKNEVPDEILDSVSPFLKKSSRIRYYFQTDGEDQSYEIKARKQGRDYSVEFQKNGKLIDIEMLVDFAEIPDDSRNNITEYLQEKYDKYVFTRIQQQYYPQEKDAEEAMEDFMEEDFEEFDIRYELEVDTRHNNKLDSYELLFDTKGKFMKERKIIRRAGDNIFY